MNTAPGQHSVNRLIEWCCSSIVLGFSLATAITYGQKQSGAFLMLANSGFGDFEVIVTFTFIALASMGALYANGHWQPYGSWLRAACSVLRAMIWGVLFVALITIHWKTGVLYRGAIVTYGVFTLFELLSCHRAANDSRIGCL